LNVTHQLLVYASDVNILGGNTYTIKKKTEGLLDTSLEIKNKTKYIVMTCN